MSSEVTVQAGLQIRKVDATTNITQIDYQSRPTSFKADLNGVGGPSPGLLIVPVTGRDVYFTELVTPGFCRISNLDTTNRVSIGTKEPQTNTFYPFLEVGPGQSFVIQLDRNLQQQYTGSGSGGASGGNYMHIKAWGGTVSVLVEAFEK